MSPVLVQRSELEFHLWTICLSACHPASGIKVPWNLCLYESFSQHNSQRPLNYVQLLQLLQLAHATLYPPFSLHWIIILPCRNPPSPTSELASHHPLTPPSNHRMFSSTRRAHCLPLIAEKQHWGKKDLISTPSRQRVRFKLYLE